MALASPPPDEPLTGGSSHQQKTQQQASLAAQSSKGAAAAREDGREEEEASSPTGTVLFVGFNQDNGCFACGTDAGFRIFNCEPFKETFWREHNGGVGLVEMLFRCNILAVVGGGASPRFPPNKVMIWDDHLGRCIGELSFRSEVRAVRLKRDRIIVVLEHKIYVYNFSDLKLLQQIDTTSNPKGLCAVSPSVNSSVLVCPGLNRGQVRVENYGLKKTMFISAHDSSIACFALTIEGKTLATASTKGTLIRIFNTSDGTQLQELRRGSDRAEIFSLCFSSNAQWLAVSSDKGTVHVFTLKSPTVAEEKKTVESPTPSTGGSAQVNSGNGNNSGNPAGTSGALSPGGANPGSSFSFLKGVLPKYFSSEWSFAQFRLPDETRAIVAFGPQKNTLVVVGTDGSFYKCAFDPVHGGAVTQLEYRRFLKPEEEVAA